MSKTSLYEKLGVDPHKDKVRGVFHKIVKNDFPHAFCVLARDAEHPGSVKVKHSDGSGSKSVQRCLHYFETGDEKIFRDDICDALSSNTSDIAACGFVENYEVTDVVNINSKNVPKDAILAQLGLGFQEMIALYDKYGLKIEFLGGETADLPDQVNSYAIDIDVRAETEEKNIVRGNVEAGDLIFGFASDGQAEWEEKPNSGMMTNGLTMARTVLMSADYNKKYPFLSGKNLCQGKYKIGDEAPGLDMTVGEAILCPMRQWAIVIKMLIAELEKQNAFQHLHGLCINTGGGLTKIRSLGEGVRYVKNIPEPPALFKLIQSESGESWENMCVAFNMGVGLEVVGSGEGGTLKAAIEKVSAESGVRSLELGKCEKAKDKNEVALATPFGSFEY